MAVAEAALIRAEQVAQLDSRASALSGRINALEGELTQTIAELFDLKAHEGVGWRSPGHYVAWLTGTARGRTKALVTTAQNLTAFPHTVGRLNSGEISLDQAAAVVGTAPAWADQAMAEASGSMTPGQLATAARIHRAVEQAQHADETASTTPTRSAPPVDEFAVFHADDTGAYRGRLRLDADHGAEFEAALRAHLEALWNQWKADGGIGRRPGPVDAFLRMMRRAAEADRASLGPTTDHHRHLVVLHVDVNTQVGQAHMGPVLPAWVTEAWSCDATFQMLFMHEGRALGVGPRRRIPERLRLAVEQRDGGCRVPGCGSRIAHLHHIHHHARGGVSETWNLVGLCPTHHRGLHRGELTMRGTDADDPAGLEFFTATGNPMRGPRPPTPPDPHTKSTDRRNADGGRAIRPEFGRVDWSNVVPFPPRAGTPSPERMPACDHDQPDSPPLDHSG